MCIQKAQNGYVKNNFSSDPTFLNCQSIENQLQNKILKIIFSATFKTNAPASMPD